MVRPGKFYDASIESSSAPAKFNADNYAMYFQDTVQIAPQWDVLFGVRA